MKIFEQLKHSIIVWLMLSFVGITSFLIGFLVGELESGHSAERRGFRSAIRFMNDNTMIWDYNANTGTVVPPPRAVYNLWHTNRK